MDLTEATKRTEARKRAEENSKRNDMKQHADKLIQGFQKLSDSHAKRAIWELFQNALDLSDKAEIIIEHTPDALIFKHNGKPFDDNTLNCLIKQVSSKSDESNDEEIGQYGTGFICTHSFGRKILLSGSLENDSIFIPLKKFEIDRTAKTSNELIVELVKQQDIVFDLIENGESNSCQSDYTEFAYQTESELQKSYAEEAMKSLPIILPYVMVLNEKLKKITVKDKEDKINVYERGAKISNDSIFDYRIIIDGVEKLIYTIENPDPQISIILPINQKNESFKLGNQLSKLFLFYPLIGTELFGINFIIHSKHFCPTEQRDGIYLKSKNEQVQENEEKNRSLIKKASDMIFEYMEKYSALIKNPINLAQINFNIVAEKPELKEYFSKLKFDWIEKFKNYRIVESEEGNISPFEALFFKNELLNSEFAFDAIYSLVKRYLKNIPKKNLVHEWTKVITEWLSVDDNENPHFIKFLSIKDLVLNIQKDSELKKFEKSEDLQNFYKYLIENGLDQYFTHYKLLPNINGEFRLLSELNHKINLPEILIEIANVIMPEVSGRHIHNDFKFDLKLTAYNRKNYYTDFNSHISNSIKDDSTSEVVSADYLSKWIDYCKITTSPDSDSGPVKLIKLICQYYDKNKDLIVIPSIIEDDLDIRTALYKLLRLFLNDISKKDSKWILDNIEYLKDVISTANSYTEFEKILRQLPVFPNQINEFSYKNELFVDDNIPEEIKDLYDTVVQPSSPIRTNLIKPDFTEFIKDKEKRDVRSLTEKIESIFFKQIPFSIVDHPHKKSILEIIEKFKTNSEYEKYFSSISAQKSSILVQLADGEDTFKILSLDSKKIKKLATLGSDPNFDEIVKLGEEAFISQQQNKGNLQHMYIIGTHIEKILRDSLTKIVSEKIIAEVDNVQDGQDIIIKIDNIPVYYIEIKSRWDVNNSVRMSKNQTLRANEQKGNYALCTVDMTKYTGQNRYNVHSIEEIEDLIRFNTDIGNLVIGLIPVLTQIYDPDSIHLDGDFRTIIPQKIIEEGKQFREFQVYLINYLKEKNVQPN